MKRKFVFCAVIFLLAQGMSAAAIFQVPSRTYPDIQTAITAAAPNGDTIVVAPNPNPYYPVAYTGPRNRNLDFGTKNITIRSQINPANPNWNIINSTIIDCGGDPGGSPLGDGGNQNRAFYFHGGQNNTSRVIGFKIINGYARGPKGADGNDGFFGNVWRSDIVQGRIVPWRTGPPEYLYDDFDITGDDPCGLPPLALSGNRASGNGYGGAIRCENSSSPTIQYCVFENCTVTGAQGGRGATGMSGPWNHYTWEDFNWADGNTYRQLSEDADLEENLNGQWGGDGNDGNGIGFGGAIACLGNNSNPPITGCIFRNNSAQGGRGGDGGTGGNAAYYPDFDDGDRGGGGRAGESIGDGKGGAIYAAGNCNPVITDCNFENNVAKSGPRAQGGVTGQGGEGSPPAPRGLNGIVDLSFSMAGGAVYFDRSANASFTNCNFVENKAYFAYPQEPNVAHEARTFPPAIGDYAAGYTYGGAVYFVGQDASTAITIDTCKFIENSGGALFCGFGSNLIINNAFAMGLGQPGRKNIFQGNTAPDWGGAILIYPQSFVDISNANFGGNRAGADGGAIKSLSSVIIANCAFSGNVAEGYEQYLRFYPDFINNYGYGGAIDVYDFLLGTELDIYMSNCSFVDNESIWGGALSSEIFHAWLENCLFADNKAQFGGALDLGLGTVNITNSALRGNRATAGDGGAINCRNTSAQISTCEFFNNSARGLNSWGGAIIFNGQANPDFHYVQNCLFAGNSSDSDGGAIACAYGAQPYILNSTFSENTADEFGGAIFVDYLSSALPYTQITDCIFYKNNNHAIHEEDFTGNATTRDCLFFDNPDGHYYDSSTGLVYDDPALIPGGSNNIEGDPLFVTGTLGNYYLSQIDAGQSVNSPALNNGSDLASNIGLDIYTTRTDDVGDAGQVDIGYHFRKAVDVPRFHLTTSVVGGQGTISVSPPPLPDSTYYAGAIVTVTAQPQTGWVVKQWTGTEDDSERASTATVVMNSDRLVTVEFRQPRTFLVSVGGGTGWYADIADAMHDANEGDIIVVYPGVYSMPQLRFNKSVEVRSQNPEDPNWVAQTVLDYTGRAATMIVFPTDMDSGAILNGFLIRNATWTERTGEMPEITTGQNGDDGEGITGAAILIGPYAGPVIKNCIIRDNWITGGFGNHGANADEFHNAGRGGWGGWARGGAVYCSIRSYPKFINCQILNNQAIGGFGGSGGDEADPGGWANYGGNFSRTEWYNYDPRDLTIEWIQGDLWVRWTELAPLIPGPDFMISSTGQIINISTSWWDDYGNPIPGYFGDYRWYSGYGGGVFINEGSEVTFENCTISGNLAEGGLSGLGGFVEGIGPLAPEPLRQYEIPAFGGGVYVAKDSIVTFNGCTINNNIASDPNFDHQEWADGLGYGGHLRQREGIPPYDPANHFSLDPYLGHGGGVCAELGADVTFVDCTLSGNRASVGGGLFGAEADLEVSDCEFVANQAYLGGGMFGQDGRISIARSQFTDNTAPNDPNKPEVLGEGGAIHLWSAQADIADTTLTGNDAEASGGGAFFKGDGFTSLRNCLATNNLSGKEGGAISASIFAQLRMTNCTIANNIASGLGFGSPRGGGLHVSEQSSVDIIDSIIWGNLSTSGSQISLADTVPNGSTATIRFSDVNRAAEFFEGAPTDPNGLPVIRAGFDVNSLPGNDDASTDLINIGFTINFFGNQYSQLYVNNNGNVTFESPLADFTPFGLTGYLPEGSIIAPLFADVDTRSGNLTTYGPNTIGGRNAFGATWNNVGYFAQHTDKLNSFQVLIIDRSDRAPGDFDIEFNYEGIEWETGDASYGVNGFGGFSAHAGFSNGTGNEGTFYGFPGSGIPGAFLDSSPATGLIYGSRRSGVNGRYIFIVRGGVPELLAADSFYVEPSTTLDGFEWNEGAGVWRPSSGSGNTDRNPLFVEGYLLSQEAAGQVVTSPCVDTGSGEANAPSIGMDDYTTRTDSVGDAGIVDMGYHYRPFFVPQYLLTVTAIPVAGLSPAQQPVVIEPSPSSGLFDWIKPVTLRVNQPPEGYEVLWTGTDDDTVTGTVNTVRMDSDRAVSVTFVSNTAQLTVQVLGNGTVTPMGGTYHRGTVVDLTATPAEDYRLRSWSGTDNDLSTALTNTVTMNGDKIVTVEFSLPTMWTVPGDFTTIQAAVNAAGSGDVISVASGVYNTPGLQINKEITVTSTNPEDPCVVAATVIDGSGIASIGVYFGTGTNERTVFMGITIANCGYGWVPADDGENPGDNGGDGGLSYGGGMLILGSPLIKNCVIRNCNISGGEAGNGANADETINAGHGGWGGWARGAGIYVAPLASPKIVNTTITGNTATGGNGGNGGDFAEDGGDAAPGGNWSNGVLWQIWGYEGDYRLYSGYGAGVYCEQFSSPTFIACNITNNTALGGMSGIGGNRGEGIQIPMPDTSYRIPSYGGGVYCGANSAVTFTRCNITGNIAPKPDATFHLDPYLGHGGGVAFENTASIRFEKCNINGNTSAVGGGMFWSGGSPELNDCNVFDNVAYVGGGIFGTESAGLIKDCNLSGNFAGIDTNDVDVIVGQGGGMFCSSMNADINDCVLTNNIADASGGGIYVFGLVDYTTVIQNCLLEDNQAGRDGGAISANWNAIVSVENCAIVNNLAIGSNYTGNYGGGIAANWYSDVLITNCTIADNVSGELGGGISSFIGSNVEVNDSIIWGNFATRGLQVAVGYEEESPAAVDISYSDIGPRMGSAAFASELTSDIRSSGATLIEGETIYNQFSSGAARAEVIVSLREPLELRASTNWRSPASVGVLRNELSSRRSSVLATLSTSDFQVDHVYENQAGFAGKVSQAGLSNLLANPLVQYVEPVRYVCLDMAQALALANATEARQTYDGRGVAIAIVDSGVDYTHPRLGGGGFPNSKVIGGRDTGDNDADPYPVSEPHGTAVAGIAAGGLGTVGDYIGGVAPAAKLYALKVSGGVTDVISNAATLAAWDWCITHQYDDPCNPILVINNSWGQVNNPFDNEAQADELFPAHTIAAATAEAAGITIVAASGNDGFAGEGISWPAAMSNVISVGAVYDVSGQVTEYSNTAANLDVLAPADPIYTTDIVGAGGYTTGDYTPNFNGTSAASPFVAGMVADIQSAAMSELGSYFTPGQIRTLLTLSGVPVTDTKVDITKPRVDLGRAIASLRGSAIFVAQGSSLTGWDANAAEPGMWDPNYAVYRNITEDPLFVAGYLLSQVAAGQDFNSPCVDAGSGPADAPSIGMDAYTTRTDSVPDSGIVDMGYHYNLFTVPQYMLTVTAIPVGGLIPAEQPVVLEPSPPSGLFDWFKLVTLRVNAPPAGYQVLWTGTDNDTVTGTVNTVRMTSDRTVTVTFVSNISQLTVQIIGQGTVTPMGGTYARGTVVELTATPAEDYRLRSWTGTNNDASTALTNTVTMNADNKIVTVEFGVPALLTVPGDYTTIQAAVNAARSGDVISVAAGVYYTPGLVINREITITSTNPDDPCVVAATVIDSTGIASIGVYFGPGTNERTIFNGLTIANINYTSAPVQAADGANPGEPGGDGSTATGGGMYIAGSPLIKNCVITNCSITAGNGGNGAAADATVNAGHGGWGGWARGAGIYIAPFTRPIIRNTIITDCTVTGGNGGNGGDSSGEWGAADYRDAAPGGNWSDGLLYLTWGYPRDYRFYSGYGAGVFCGENSAPTFIACSITNNTALGGMSGIGGTRPDGIQIPMPDTSFRVPSFGGGVYCDAGSNVSFIDCNITDNTAPKPDATYHLDPYLGHGGGIAFEDTANIRLENCNISDNNSAVGGGIYWSGGDPEIIDSNISGNVAYVGGGIYASHSSGLVENCTFSNNFAGVEPNDVDTIAGQGAAFFAASMSGSIVDSIFNSNTAGASGGGMYIFGINDDQTTVKNCLFLDNEAGRDGGAISVNWNAVASVENCTLYNNGATGQFGVPGSTGFGGGLYCSYGANTSVIDSIFWNNFAVLGPQLAVETGFEHDPMCGSVNISYSDIRDGQAGVEVGSGCTLIWGTGNKSTDPMFVNSVGDDFHLRQIAAGQSADSPCVNTGSDTATNLGLSFYTTRTDGVPDRTIVDMGYHYPVLEPCRFADLKKDGIINLLDFARLAAKWLEDDCGISNNYCQGADLTLDTLVGLDDLDVITDCWLERDKLSPLPNPSRWALEPEGIWPSSVKMRATDAVDRWGLPVQYEFDETSGNPGGSDSGWRSDANYTDTGLTQSIEYSYRVRARDAAGNTTGWSVVRSAVIGPDVTPPAPNPMTWRIAPRVLTPTSVEMAATTATDTSGSVQYEFNETTGNPGATDSGWRNDPCYIDTGLTTSSSYCYRVRARDASDNVTGWSTEICLGNLGDSNPPTPAPAFIISPDINYVAAETYDISGQFQFMEFPVDYRWWHKIVVNVAGITDNVTPVEELEVRFSCLDDGRFNSTNRVPVPITLGLGDVVLGGRVNGWRVTIIGDTIVYDVDVDTYAVTGRCLEWVVCVYDEAGNPVCSAVHLLGPNGGCP